MSKTLKNDDDSGAGDPFQNLDKTTVLQETRHFNDTPLKSRKCSHILAKIIYLVNQGEKFTSQEATDAFFATTKLFQSKDIMLRRMVYLCIKELSSMAQDVIIVTSSLTKDMTGKEDMYRAAAIRALCCITDSSMLQAIERYMKQAIVDKNASVSSAALVSALHLASAAPDLVKRWANEAQEAMNSDDAMVSYHALGLIANMRQNDKLSTIKLVTRLANNPMKSPYAICLLIRLAAHLVEDENSPQAKPYLDFIERCLRHKSEMVIYEAAHAIVNLRNNVRDLPPAVSVLQLFCGSSKPALRLAGTKTLAKLTMKHPNAVQACALDLENLITDSNRSIATLAVTTLLATGAESSIDRLLKQISSFLSEISDEFKVIVVSAIKGLCTKYPKKHAVLSKFLAGMLRDEGGLEYKEAIADALIALIEENPEAKEVGLAHLCEFIEDCEHTSLAVRILHLLGREGPKTRQPSRYIRFIYNRVILESGPVRAAAVSAVAQFGAQRPELLPNIKVLLTRCQLDEEDEVRDRAIYYSAILDTNDQDLIDKYIVNIHKPNPMLLLQALQNHLETNPNEPFDVLTVPAEEPKVKEVIVTEVKKPVVSREEQYSEKLAAIENVKKFGSIFKTSDPIELTEPEIEYQVKLTKHVFAKHLILHFECTNTLSDQILEHVRVKLEIPSQYTLLDVIECDALPFDKEGNIYCILQFPEFAVDSIDTFGATLEFSVRDCDPTTGAVTSTDSYNDNYPLEDIEIGCAEQLRCVPANADWDNIWERNNSGFEASETFVLPQENILEAAKAICDCYGITDKAITGDMVKEVKGNGVFRGGCPLMFKSRLAMTSGGVTMQLAVKSMREDVAQFILAAVG